MMMVAKRIYTGAICCKFGAAEADAGADSNDYIS